MQIDFEEYDEHGTAREIWIKAMEDFGKLGSAKVWAVGLVNFLEV